MKAIRFDTPGSAEVLYLGEALTPIPKPNELLVKVHATALNRADILQREGKYPPPPDASEILGLEMAGEVVTVGSAVQQWRPGDQICGLLSGGGYAEYAVIHEALALPIPEHFSYEMAASIPEAFLTAFQALYQLAHLQSHETVLLHAGASGVGTAAIQLAKAAKATVIVTTSVEKHGLCCLLGADFAIDYKTEDFAVRVKEYAGGADIVVDVIGAPYWLRNLEVLKMDGRLVQLALMGGAQVEPFSMALILRKRLKIIGSTLRNRSLEYKIALTRDFRLFAWEGFAKGTFQPVIDRVFDWQQVTEAHRYMESNRSQGKIVLRIS